MNLSSTKEYFMNAAQLTARLTEIERMQIRSATTEGAVLALYNYFRPELPGGNLHGGTEAEGLEVLKEVIAQVNTEFAERSKSNGFPRSLTC
jgi:hypothetical protein